MQPQTWTTDDYTNKRYSMFQLPDYTDEYRTVYTDFSGSAHRHLTILNIKRIQHPFAFCRFCLRKQHLEDAGHAVQERREFYRLSKDINLNRILEHNCDKRIDGCFQSAYNNYGSSKYIIVVKIIDDLNDNDSNCYPEYLIECSLNSNNNTDLVSLLDRLNLYK
ncbi:hypothetical protein FQA39_LY18433 [Lamprigera yunnana]|nr:hypothetical protein FQA39_LY18433 [Lamprigera yunnana]